MHLALGSEVVLTNHWQIIKIALIIIGFIVGSFEDFGSFEKGC